MKEYVLSCLYVVEITICKILKFFRLRQKTNVIPKGLYCYSCIEPPNKENGWNYKTQSCPYYRRLWKGGSGCTYLGYSGYDPALYDQCKICGENENY